MLTVSGFVKLTLRWIPEFRMMQSKSECDSVMLQGISDYAITRDDGIKQTFLQNLESWKAR